MVIRDGDKRWFTREEEDVLEFTSGGLKPSRDGSL